MRHAIALLLLAAALSFSSPASAQDVDAETRSAARILGQEANALFEARDYAGALEKYNRAQALVAVPTLGVRAARCLVKLGRLVEAAERYVTVGRMQLPKEAQDVHKQALEDAKTELAALEPRIPKVVLTVEGNPPGAQVDIDGKRVPEALLGAKRPIDPGQHTVLARGEGGRGGRTFTVKEGQTLTVVLKLSGDAGPPLASAPEAASAPPAEASPAATSAPTETAPTPPPPDAPEVSSSASPLRTVGWVGIGLGGAGLVLGAVTGGLAASKQSELEVECPNGQCATPEARADNDNYDTLRTLSTAGLVAGGVLAATGIVLVIVAPGAKSSAKTGVRVAPWLGLSSFGARGAF